MAELYVATNDITYVFNQGRCLEQNSLYEEALGRFKEYLRKATAITDFERADVEKHIAECDAAIAKPVSPPPQAPPPLPAPSAPATATPPPSSEPAVPSLDDRRAVPPTPAPPAPSAWRTPVMWTALGVSVLALTVGTVEYVTYRNKGDEFNSAGCNNSLPDAGGAKCKSLADAQDLAQLGSIIGVSLAGVAGATALVLWLTSPKDTVASPTSRAGLSCGPDTGRFGLACWGRF